MAALADKMGAYGQLSDFREHLQLPANRSIVDRLCSIAANSAASSESAWASIWAAFVLHDAFDSKDAAPYRAVDELMKRHDVAMVIRLWAAFARCAGQTDTEWNRRARLTSRCCTTRDTLKPGGSPSERTSMHRRTFLFTVSASVVAWPDATRRRGRAFNFASLASDSQTHRDGLTWATSSRFVSNAGRTRKRSAFTSDQSELVTFRGDSLQPSAGFAVRGGS